MANGKMMLVGSKSGVPTPEDLVALYKKVTGRTPSPAEVAKMKATLAKGLPK